MKPLQVSTFDRQGGAARAAYRIHKALLEAGTKSEMFTNFASEFDNSIFCPNDYRARLARWAKPQIIKPLRKLLHTTNRINHSISLAPSRWPQRINQSDCNIANLHWVQGEMLSIADVPKIQKPVVWTLHDMWLFCGAEHYTTDSRWEHGYVSSNRPSYERGYDLNRWTWERKLKHWRRDMHLICPSRWMAECAKKSILLKNSHISVIPYPIDLKFWKPTGKYTARKKLGIDQNVKVVLFGAAGGGADPRKGFDLLVEALFRLDSAEKAMNIELLVFGQSGPSNMSGITMPVRYVGELTDDSALRDLYNAADAMVVPSRQDNLPNTGMEAQACGTPVVAFDVCGMPDVVADKVTGSLAEPFDSESLACSIEWVLRDESRNSQLGDSARKRAEAIWSPEKIAQMTMEKYRITIEMHEEDSF